MSADTPADTRADIDPAIAAIVGGARTRFFEAIAAALVDAGDALRDDGYCEHIIACAAVSATATAYATVLIENVPLDQRETTHADVLRNLRGHLDCAAAVEMAGGGAFAVPAGATVQ